MQVTVLPAVHAPAWHVLSKSHSFAFVHDAPLVTGEYAVVLTLGWHVSHVFVPFVAPDATHAPPMTHEPAGHAREPNPSWHVTVAPEFMSTCAAAIAPVNFAVFTVTSACVATKSACTSAPELESIPDDVSRYRTSALAVRPDPDAGPVTLPLLKLADPVMDSVVAAVTASVDPLFMVKDEKT